MEEAARRPKTKELGANFPAKTKAKVDRSHPGNRRDEDCMGIDEGHGEPQKPERLSEHFLQEKRPNQKDALKNPHSP